jgi:hypothetical protein
MDKKVKPLTAATVPFGSSTPQPTQMFSVDKPASAPQTAGFGFGNNQATSAFGNVSSIPPTTSAPQSVGFGFGNNQANTTVSPFGSSTPQNQQLFNNSGLLQQAPSFSFASQAAATVSSSQPNQIVNLGKPTSAPQASGFGFGNNQATSVFGNVSSIPPTTSAPQSTGFGFGNIQANTTASPFGSSTPQNQQLFNNSGQQQQAPSFSFASQAAAPVTFGSSTPQTTNQNVFSVDKPASAPQAVGFSFGNNQANTTASPFGSSTPQNQQLFNNSGQQQQAPSFNFASQAAATVPFGSSSPQQPNQNVFSVGQPTSASRRRPVRRR